MSEQAIKAVDARLNGNGLVIFEEAKGAGLELALAAALVEQESGGFNVFGHDHGIGLPDRPPYSGHPVTKERVKALRDNGNYSHGMQGIGCVQLTWWEFVEEAEREGGAHLPRYQCRVGFRLLKDYVDRYPYLEALGAYNAGEQNRRSVLRTYAAELAAKHEGWKTRLGGSLTPEYPTTWLKSLGWQTDDKGRYAKVRARTKVLVDPEGWQYAMPIGPEPPVVPGGTWLERHPTRYTWRQDVEELILRILVKFPGVTITTYVDHPEGYGLDTLSFDVWGEKGRGDPIGSARGQQVLDFVFNDPNPPLINWTVWNGRIWVRGEGWSSYGGENDDPITDARHTKHPHFTMV